MIFSNSPPVVVRLVPRTALIPPAPAAPAPPAPGLPRSASPPRPPPRPFPLPPPPPTVGLSHARQCSLAQSGVPYFWMSSWATALGFSGQALTNCVACSRETLFV